MHAAIAGGSARKDKGKEKVCRRPRPYSTTVRRMKRTYNRQITDMLEAGNNMTDYLYPRFNSSVDTSGGCSSDPMWYGQALLALESLVGMEFIETPDAPIWTFGVSWLRDQGNRRAFLQLFTTSARLNLLIHHYTEMYFPDM